MPPIIDSRIEEYLFERNAMDRLTRVPVTGDEQIGCVRFDRVWMAAPNFFPITADGHAFLHFFGIFATKKYAALYTAELRETIARNESMLDSADCTSGTFVLGGAHAYYHWLIDFVPRLYLLQHDPSLRRRPIIVNHQFMPWQQDSLTAIFRARGWDLPPLIRMPAADLVPLRDAVVPGRVDRASAVHILGQLYPIEGGAKTGRVRLFVGRDNVQYRRLVNQDDVAALLARAGFRAINPAQMSFAEQAALFSRAEIVVGAHGAALTNLVFAPPGSVLLELWSGLRQPHYVDLARARGVRYAALEGETLEGADPRLQHRDFRIDLDRLSTALSSLI